MKTFWRRLTGAEAPSRPSTAGRPRARTRRVPEVGELEGRQLLTLVFAQNSAQAPVPVVDKATGDFVQNTVNGTTTYQTSGFTTVPGIVATPQVLPNNGSYVPVRVSGEFMQISVSLLEGSMAVTKYPYHVASNIAHQATLVTTSTGATTPPKTKFPTMQVRINGYNQFATLTPLMYPTKPTPNAPTVPAVVVQLPIPAFEQQVIFERLTGRPAVKQVLLQVTDQYRQYEPHAAAAVQINNSQGVLYNITGKYASLPQSSPQYRFFNDPEPAATEPKDLTIAYTVEQFNHGGILYVVQIPTAVSLANTYTYSGTVQLQARANSGTGGRQYIIDASATDADNGSEANVAVVVPGK